MYNTMGVYTLELGQIIKHGGVVFDFDYPFYNEEHKKVFEYKFLLHYRYNEIGQETLARFKYMLQDLLVLNYPKYLHYYQTELKAKELQWWNNKDYHTEHTRELVTNDNATNNSINNNTNTNTFNTNSNDIGNSTSKYLDTPMGQVKTLNDDYLTNATIDSTNTNITTTGKNDVNSTNSSTSSNVRNSNNKETITTNEYGNIGTTSSGDLVKSWLEDACFNIDKMIINDCQELFMQIY